VSGARKEKTEKSKIKFLKNDTFDEEFLTVFCVKIKRGQ